MKLTLKKLIILLASILAVVTFVMMFVSPLTVDLGILGSEAAEFKDVYFPEEGGKFLWPSVLAYGLSLLAAIGLFLTCLKKAKNVRLIRFISSLILIAVGIVLFCTIDIYIGINELPSDTKDILVLGTGPTLGAIFALVGGVATLIVDFALKD